MLIALIPIVPRLLRNVIRNFGKRAVELELRFVLAILLAISFFADQADLHSVFGAFVLGLIFANSIQEHQEILSKMRTVTFTLLAPAFFIRAGMLIALPVVIANILLVLGLLGTKLGSKFVGVYALCKKWIPEAPIFSTMLFSTGLTVGTIVATLGNQLGYLSNSQFSIIVTVLTREDSADSHERKRDCWGQGTHNLGGGKCDLSNSENLFFDRRANQISPFSPGTIVVSDVRVS